VWCLAIASNGSASTAMSKTSPIWDYFEVAEDTMFAMLIAKKKGMAIAWP